MTAALTWQIVARDLVAHEVHRSPLLTEMAARAVLPAWLDEHADCTVWLTDTGCTRCDGKGFTGSLWPVGPGCEYRACDCWEVSA